ncbi:MAG: dual specificity protein phosphatase family protein [Anaerolineae bacterium]
MIPGKLAGSGKPFLSEELLWLRDQGIGAIVSLTERSLRREKMVLHRIDVLDFEYRHIPIVDHTAPQQRQIDEFVDFVHQMLGTGRPVLVHCEGGYGRTGTMLACYLVSLGYGPCQAIERVREERPGAIENGLQEECVFEYAHRLERISEVG